VKRTPQARLNALVAAVGDGETGAGACRRPGLSRDTVYSLRWRDPGCAAALARAGARPRLRVVPLDLDVPFPSHDELLRRLNEQSRNSSTRATEPLLRETVASVPSEGPATADRFLGLHLAHGQPTVQHLRYSPVVPAAGGD
jgi:hypothetical protein